MRFWIKFLSVTVVLGCCMVIAARVDPKLDFGEVAARVEEQQDNVETGKGQTTNIRGVRVTVETKPETKGSPESKSSESSESSSSGDRTSSGSIGVRTDVTFEISNETNETKSQEDIGGNKKKGGKDKKKNVDDDEEGDIPVIKGRTTPPKKGPEVTTWRPLVRPIFPKTEPDDSFRSRGGSPNIPWTKNFPGSAVWTTERNYFGLYDNYDNNNNFNPSQPVGTHIPPHRHPQEPHHFNPSHVQFYPTWEACRCDLLRPESGPGIWSPSSSSLSGIPPTNHKPSQYHYTVVDDKLDEPFSVKDRKRSQGRRRRESRES